MPIKPSLPTSLSPQPLATIIFFLSLRTHLLWTFHINGIIHHVVCGVWLLSLNIIFSR